MFPKPANMVAKNKFLSTVKEKIILGAIAAFFTLLVAYLKGCFNPTEAAKIDNSVNNHTIQKNKNDSGGTQYNAARDLIINNAPIIKIDSNKKSIQKEVHRQSYQANINPTAIAPKKDTAIINNGIINNGGVGNTYNQTVNPNIPQREFGIVAKNELSNLIPAKANSFYIHVYNYDHESLVFAKEIVDYLVSKKYTIVMTPIGEIMAEVPKDAFGKSTFNLSKDSTFFDIIVFPLK